MRVPRKQRWNLGPCLRPGKARLGPLGRAQASRPCAALLLGGPGPETPGPCSLAQNLQGVGSDTFKMLSASRIHRKPSVKATKSALPVQKPQPAGCTAFWGRSRAPGRTVSRGDPGRPATPKPERPTLGPRRPAFRAGRPRSGAPRVSHPGGQDTQPCSPEPGAARRPARPARGPGLALQGVAGSGAPASLHPWGDGAGCRQTPGVGARRPLPAIPEHTKRRAAETPLPAPRRRRRPASPAAPGPREAWAEPRRARRRRLRPLKPPR